MQKRADILLVEQGLVESRARAQVEISAGQVFVGKDPVRKASQRLHEGAELHLKARALPWVSRAALKLGHALAHFDLGLEGRCVLDLGACTGGFSEVALKSGAAHVFAVDVGRGQLHASLKGQERLTSMEGVNARNLVRGDFDRPIDVIVSDLSFISLKLGLSPALEICEPGGTLIALIKPQFEAGKERVGRGGIVKDPSVHKEIVSDIEAWINEKKPWQVLGVTPSPITGSDGNQEFLIAAEKKKI